MNPTFKFFLAAACAPLAFSGCATTFLRKVEPSLQTEACFTFLPPEGTAGSGPRTDPTFLPLSGALAGMARIGFLDHRHQWATAKNVTEDNGDSYYAVVVLNDLTTSSAEKLDAAARKSQRDQLAGVLLIASDHNAYVWLGRVFNNKTSAETTKGILNDLFVGTGAVVAKTHSALTAGLNVASIAVSKSIENIDKNFFANQSYLAVEAVIRSRRKELSDRIGSRLTAATADEYRLDQVLRDLQELDEVCSLKAGLRELQRKAGEDAASAKIAPSIGVQPAGKPVKIGEAVTLSVTVAGTEPLTYTWYRAGKKIPGASGATFSLGKVDATDFNVAYAVQVLSPYGSVLSNVVELVPIAIEGVKP